MADITQTGRCRATGLTRHTQERHQELTTVMRCCGRQCRGQGHGCVKLVRHTEQKLLRLGEPMTTLGRQAQPLLAQTTTLSDVQRQRVAEACTVALSTHAPIRPPSTRLSHGQKLRHGQLVKAADLTIAPLLKGKSHGPVPFGRKPGMASAPATGCRFANRVPAGHPSDSSSVLPRLATVQQAIPRVTTLPRLRVHAAAGALGLHEETLRQALHTRGILTVGIPKTIAPVKAHPSPEEILALLNEAGLNRPRTPYHVQLACVGGYSRPVVESHIASLLARGAGQGRSKGLEGAVRQQGMIVLAHHGAVLVRIRRQQLSKRAQKFRRLLGRKSFQFNEINHLKN